MNIAIAGAGGVGGYFGGRLAQGGAAVALLARGAQLAAIQKDGLRLALPEGVEVISELFASDDVTALARRGPFDLVIIAVKLWDSASTLRQIAPLVGPGTAVVSFQNGVLKDDELASAFGPAAVIGGVSYVSAAIAEPGVIRRVGPMQRLIFGEPDGTASARVAAFQKACQAGGIDAVASDNIQRATWEKFVFLVGFSAATTSMRSAIGPIRENPQTRAFLHDLMDEAVRVGRAHGIDLPPDFARDRLAFIDTLSSEASASMRGDLERGNRLEVPWLSGGVVALGARVGIAAPLNRAVADILALQAKGQAPS